MKNLSLKIILLLLIAHFSIEKIYSQISPNDSLLKTQTDSILPIQQRIHPYKINVWVSGGISVVGSVGNYFAIPRIKGKKRISDEEIATLNSDVLTDMDHWALEQDGTKRVYYDKMSDKVLTGIFILPVLLALDKNIRHDGLKLLLMYYECSAITFSIFNYSFFGPTFQDKFRPMAYYKDIPVDDRNIGNNRNSFFAGHVSSATAASFFMAKVYCDYHPNIGNKKYLLYAAATIPGFTISYLRVLALKHFPSDALVGMIIGAACGVAIPALHKIHDKKLSVSVFASPQGTAGLNLNWKLSRKNN